MHGQPQKVSVVPHKSVMGEGPLIASERKRKGAAMQIRLAKLMRTEKGRRSIRGIPTGSKRQYYPIRTLTVRGRTVKSGKPRRSR